MLDRLRSSMQSGATYLLVAALIVIFMFFFGMPSQTCSGERVRASSHLATVAGEDLYTADLDVVYNRSFGADRTDDLTQFNSRRAIALKTLTLIELFSHRARQAGLRTSLDEVKTYLQNPARNPEFRHAYGQSGSFSGKYYKRYVQNRLGSKLEQYEYFKRDELLARTYVATMAAQAAVPSAQLESTKKIQNTRLDLSFIALEDDTLQSYVEIDDEAVQSYLESNRKNIEKYYNEHKDQKYTEPKQLRIRRVLVERPGDSADEQTRQSAEQKWKEAKKRVLENDEPVADVAEELGKNIPGQKKGLMEWKTRDDMTQKVYDAVEGVEVGTIKKVKTEYDYQLVKLEGRKEKKVTPLEEVESDIARTLLQRDRVGELRKSVEKELRSAADAAGSLKAGFEKLRSSSDRDIWAELEVQKTGEFTLKSTKPSPQARERFGQRLSSNYGKSWFDIPKIGESKDLAVAAFRNLSTDDPVADELYQVEETNYLVALESKTRDDSDDDDQSKFDPSVQFALETQKIGQLIGRWSQLFANWGPWSIRLAEIRPRVMGRPAPPRRNYRSWIDRQFEQALSNGTIQLQTGESAIAEVLQKSIESGGKINQDKLQDAASKLAEKQERRRQRNRPTPRKGDSKKKKKKSKGKKFKINPSKAGKKGRQIKINPGKGGNKDKSPKKIRQLLKKLKQKGKQKGPTEGPGVQQPVGPTKEQSSEGPSESSEGSGGSESGESGSGE